MQQTEPYNSFCHVDLTLKQFGYRSLALLILGLSSVYNVLLAQQSPYLAPGKGIGPDGKPTRANTHLLFRRDQEPTHASLIRVGGGAGLCAGQLAERFGAFGEVTGGYLFKSSGNWLVGFDLGYQFGEDVKENPLAPYTTADGNIIGNLGLYSVVSMQQRGLKLPMLRVGKLFPVAQLSWMDKQSSGPYITAGVGFWQHQIFIAANSELKQLQGDGSRGYDRMTNGLATSQQLGYMFMHYSRRFGVFLEVELTQGFTRSQRYDYDLGRHDGSQRLDLTHAAKAGLILPLFPVQKNELLFD